MTATTERQSRILASLVAMVNDIVWLSLTDCHFQRRQHELSPHVRFHRPTDNPAAERIEHHSEIQKPCRGRDVCNVGDPELVEAIGREVAVHQVRGRTRIVITPSGDDAMAAADANNARCPHQPGNPLLPDRPAFGSQLCMNTWCTIRAA
jgi:hypothetical protein